MSKSIFEILDDVTTETSVPSMKKDSDDKVPTIEHSISRDLFPTSEQFESEQFLMEWAETSGFTHAILQRGVQKFLIETRATFKGCKKNDIWSPEYGQANVDKMEWTTVKRPNQSGDKTAIAKAILTENLATYQMMIDVANMTEDQLTDVLLEKYNQETDIVTGILDALNFPPE